MKPIHHLAVFCCANRLDRLDDSCVPVGQHINILCKEKTFSQGPYLNWLHKPDQLERDSMPRSSPKRTTTPQPAAKPTTSHAAIQEASHTDSLGFERLLFFSDAVFAIAITLLALDIRLPPESAGLTNDELLLRLLEIWPKYLSYVISFLVIGSFWMAHHVRFRVITGYDGRLMLINLLLLMVIAFVPFPTAVLSESGNQTATIFYALTMVVAGLLSALMWWHAFRSKELVSVEHRQQGRRIILRSLIIPAVFLLSIGIAFIDDDLAKYSWLLIALLNVLLH